MFYLVLFSINVGGRYCHQASSLFTIINKHIHHRQTTKKRLDRKGQELHGNIQKEESSLYEGK